MLGRLWKSKSKLDARRRPKMRIPVFWRHSPHRHDGPVRRLTCNIAFDFTRKNLAHPDGGARFQPAEFFSLLEARSRATITASPSTRQQPSLTVPYTTISRWNTSLQFAYLIEKMKGIDEGGSTLLDNSIVLYACELRDGNGHITKNLPIVLAGRGGGIRPGRRLMLPPLTPLANLHLTIAQRMGIQTDTFNTSTGVLSDI